MFKLPKKFYNNDLIKFNFFIYLNKFKKNSKRNILFDIDDDNYKF